MYIASYMETLFIYTCIHVDTLNCLAIPVALRQLLVAFVLTIVDGQAIP